MRKYRLFAVAAALAAPVVLGVGTAHATDHWPVVAPNGSDWPSSGPDSNQWSVFGPDSNQWQGVVPANNQWPSPLDNTWPASEQWP
jgi:hypothetical protein